jgi:hypothetical protein
LVDVLAADGAAARELGERNGCTLDGEELQDRAIARRDAEGIERELRRLREVAEAPAHLAAQ